MIFAAAEETAGSRDHPMFSRMPNFQITEFSKKFYSVDFPVAEEKTEAKEANATTITHAFIENTDKRMPSPTQVIRNHQVPMVKLGGGELVHEVPKNSATFRLKKTNKEVWPKVADFANGDDGEVGQ